MNQYRPFQPSDILERLDQIIEAMAIDRSNIFQAKLLREARIKSPSRILPPVWQNGD
jgi:hypothetical protein